MNILIFLIGLVAAIVSAGTLFAQDRRTVRTLLLLHGILLLTGGICLIVSLWMYTHATADDGTLAWATDAYTLFCRVCGVSTLAIGAVTILAAFLRHKLARIRALICGAAAELILLAGVAYAAICESDKLALDTWILLLVAGCAALVTAACAIDLARRARQKHGGKTHAH